MAMYIAGLLCLLFFLILSVRIRCRQQTSSAARQLEGKESPVSRAIQATVGYAGGIYITLVMLVSFLQIEVPAKVTVADKLCVEPLAFLAVILAIVQPVLLVLWDQVRKT